MSHTRPRERESSTGSVFAGSALGHRDLMHPTPAAGSAFTHPEWVFEPQLDGLRVLAIKEHEDVRLISRHGYDFAESFPEIVEAMRALPDIALDGELVVLDENGDPVFDRVRSRMACSRELQIRFRATSDPADLCAFDVLRVDGLDIRDGPLVTRKKMLKETLDGSGLDTRIQYVEHFSKHGEALFAVVAELGLEGIIGKLAASPYRGGQTRDWVKVKTEAGRQRGLDRRSER